VLAQLWQLKSLVFLQLYKKRLAGYTQQTPEQKLMYQNLSCLSAHAGELLDAADAKRSHGHAHHHSHAAGAGAGGGAGSGRRAVARPLSAARLVAAASAAVRVAERELQYRFKATLQAAAAGSKTKVEEPKYVGFLPHSRLLVILCCPSVDSVRGSFSRLPGQHLLLHPEDAPTTDSAIMRTDVSLADVSFHLLADAVFSCLPAVCGSDAGGVDGHCSGR
jgi:hypothetical protein